MYPSEFGMDMITPSARIISLAAYLTSLRGIRFLIPILHETLAARERIRRTKPRCQ
jgi:hypothetical protein